MGKWTKLAVGVMLAAGTAAAIAFTLGAALPVIGCAAAIAAGSIGAGGTLLGWASDMEKPPMPKAVYAPAPSVANPNGAYAANVSGVDQEISEIRQKAPPPHYPVQYNPHVPDVDDPSWQARQKLLEEIRARSQERTPEAPSHER